MTIAPPRTPPRIAVTPKVRQIYWCDFPVDAQLPEFWKRRPVIIVSYRNRLYGTATVVPCTTKSQPGNPWAFPLRTTIDGRPAWAICDKLTSLAVSRLVPDKHGTPRLPADEFADMMEIVLDWLPKSLR
jgi:mRNA interferase MazF